MLADPMNAYLGFFLHIFVFLGLVVAFGYCALVLPVRMASRLTGMFVVGAYLTFFVEGPSWGTFERTSARPLVIVLGLLLMGGAGLWLWSVWGAITR